MTMRPEGEDVRTPYDHKGVGGLPREASRRRNGAAPRAPALWSALDTFVGEGGVDSRGVMGGYPRRFIPWAAPLLNVRPSEILHVCSGGLPAGVGRLRVDMRPAANPDVVADGRNLPFADDSFAAVMIDPPYSEEYAQDLYGVKYSRPSHLLAEAARVVRPGGRIGMLHFLVMGAPKGCTTIDRRGVTTGPGYRIRAFVVYEKHQSNLFDGSQSSPQTDEVAR